MKNMNPGPSLFTNNPQNIYAVYLLFIIANIIMIPLGWWCIKVSKQILKVPRTVLMPVIMLFCVVGSFAINNTAFDVTVMLVAGIDRVRARGQRLPDRAGDPGRRPGRHARGELHYVDDQVRRRVVRVLRPPGGGDAGGAHAWRSGSCRCSSAGCAAWPGSDRESRRTGSR